MRHKRDKYKISSTANDFIRYNVNIELAVWCRCHIHHIESNILQLKSSSFTFDFELH